MQLLKNDCRLYFLGLTMHVKNVVTEDCSNPKGLIQKLTSTRYSGSWFLNSYEVSVILESLGTSDTYYEGMSYFINIVTSSRFFHKYSRMNFLFTTIIDLSVIKEPP